VRVNAIYMLYDAAKMIFTSSNSVYFCNPGDHPFSEKDIPVPADKYGLSKIVCEKL